MTRVPAIQVRLNGEARSLRSPMSVADLMEDLELNRGGVAVEVNREIVPRSTYSERILEQDDQIEIVTVMGGG